MDHKTRIYTETDQGFGFFKFNLSATIDASRLFSSSPCTIQDDLRRLPIHWLTGRAFDEGAKCLEASEILKETYAEYPFMLFQVDDQGALVIWGLKGLCKEQVVTVKVLMRTNPGLYNSFIDYFAGKVEIVGQERTRLSLLVSASAGSHILVLDLNEIFTKQWISPRIRYMKRYDGPRSSSLIVSHARLPFVYIMQEQTGSIYQTLVSSVV